MNDIKRSQLVKAAKELNDVLGLEPPIDIKLEAEKLKALILEAAGLLLPEDSISVETSELINKLQHSRTVETADNYLEEERDTQKTQTSTPTPTEDRATLSGVLVGYKKKMTDIMDHAVAEGGSWDEIVAKVQKEGKALGYPTKNYDKYTLREHIKYRLMRGWINVDLPHPIRIEVTSEGVTVSPVEE